MAVSSPFDGPVSQQRREEHVGVVLSADGNRADVAAGEGRKEEEEDTVSTALEGGGREAVDAGAGADVNVKGEDVGDLRGEERQR